MKAALARLFFLTRAGQVMDGVGFARAGRPIKEQSLFRRQTELLQRRTLLDEVVDIALEQTECFFRQDDFIALNGPQLVDAHRAGASMVSGHRFQ